VYTEPLEDYTKLPKLHWYKRDLRPTAEAVKRGESKQKLCTLSIGKRVHFIYMTKLFREFGCAT